MVATTVFLKKRAVMNRGKLFMMREVLHQTEHVDVTTPEGLLL